jgi:hypothetical protein
MTATLVRWGLVPVAAVAAALVALPAAAQQRTRVPLPGLKGQPGVPDASDPQRFFDQFFGEGFGGKVDPVELDRVEFTWKEEGEYGAAQLEALKRDLKRKKIALATQGKDVQYVARLVDAIRPMMQHRDRYRQLLVYVADMETPDAYTLAGGHVIVSRGMLEQAGCEAAFVCVLGHELSHLDRGHLVRHAKQAKLAQQSLQAGERGFSMEDYLAKTGAMAGLFRRPFGLQEELQADRDGITWAYQLGYDPRALVELFDKMAARNDNPALDFMPAFFRTHPPSAERKEQVAAVYAELGKANPGGRSYLGRENLRRRLTKEQKRFDELP